MSCQRLFFSSCLRYVFSIFFPSYGHMFSCIPIDPDATFLTFKLFCYPCNYAQKNKCYLIPHSDLYFYMKNISLLPDTDGEIVFYFIVILYPTKIRVLHSNAFACIIMDTWKSYVDWWPSVDWNLKCLLLSLIYCRYSIVLPCLQVRSQYQFLP